MIATGLALDQDSAVPKDVVWVPQSAIDNGVKANSWMVFQAEGDGSTGKSAVLWVELKLTARGAVVSSATAGKLRTAGTPKLNARSLTKWNKVRRFGRGEILIAALAVLIAVAGIGVAVTKPAAERVAAEARLHDQAIPLVEQIATATSPAARDQAVAKLNALLTHRDEAHSGAAAAFTWATIVLPLLTALLVVGVATKKPLGPPS